MSFKLSLKNIKKSFKDYSIYFITLIFGVCIFYVFNSIDSQSAMIELTNSKRDIIIGLVQIINVVSVFISIILGFLIVYANNFLIKRRKKELGIYMTLGMSKRKISKILLVETILIGIISLCIGLVLGVFFSQMLSVVVANMFEVNMDKFTFVFSINSFIKTCVYFGIIYILVMIFNVITISRYKLINLLNASKKNEKIKTRNNIITFILFILSILFIGYAYYLLNNDALVVIDNKFVLMLVFGAIGTLLLFMSLAGFLMKLIQFNKKLYYSKLNMFVLRQLNNKINTTIISTTLICLMLVLTIGILSASISLKDAFNTDIKSNNLTDITLKDYKNLDKNIIENFENHKFDYKKYFSEYSSYSIYNDKTENIISLFNDEQIKELKDKYGEMISFNESYAPIVKESEYNKLMELYDKENLKVNLKDNEYLLTSDFDELIKYYDEILNENKPIVINNKTYIPQNKKCINIGLGNTNMSYNAGIFIVPDEAVIGTNKVYNYVCANYIGDKEKTEELFNNAIKNFYSKSNVAPPFSASISKIEVEASSIGMSVMITFIGLYLGIIFCITCAAILAIQQLSEASDNKQRYTILRKIGADEKMINRSLFTQIGIFFMFPLSIAIIHALVGLNELNSIVKMFGKIDISKNAFITAGFIILVYGGYFIATYIESKNIIKEKDR